MARSTLNIRFDIDRLRCIDEGDGWGNAEPYLWTVFFKVDGSTISVTPALNLAGSAVLHTTPGSHGNLGNTDVDAGDTITVPVAIGEWDTDLRPILVPPPFDAVQPDLGGVVGAVCVLMEEDNVSDDGANAGHHALDDAVRAAVDQIVATRTVTNQDVTDAELAGFESAVTSAVSDAIQNQQNFFENIWSWLNADDSIGFKVFLFEHDALASAGTVPFSHRFRNEGDWELSGSITATATCPVDVIDVLFGTESRSFSRDGLEGKHLERAEKGLRFDLDALRRFRDGPYRELPGLASWWRLAERNTPAIAVALARSPELRDQVGTLLDHAVEVCGEPDAKLDPAQLKRAAEVLGHLASSTRSRRLRIDASRAAEVVTLLEGRSVSEACKALDGFRPSRHPVVDGLGIRIRRSDARDQRPAELAAH